MHLVFELIASMNEEEPDKTTLKRKIEIEMKEIGDKSSILSPITLAITNRTINYGKLCILCSKQQGKYNIKDT